MKIIVVKKNISEDRKTVISACWWLKNINSLATLTETLYLYKVWIPLCSGNSVKSLLHKLNKVFKSFPAHVYMIAPHNWCWFFSCTFMLWISCSNTSQRCFTGFRLDVCQENVPYTVIPAAAAWLADRRQEVGSLTLPTACCSRNQDSRPGDIFPINQFDEPIASDYCSWLSEVKPDVSSFCYIPSAWVRCVVDFC